MADADNQKSDFDLPTRIYRRDGRFFAVDEDRTAIAEGVSADEAIARLEGSLTERRAKFAAAGIAITSKRAAPYGPFLVKTAAVALACVAVLVTAELIAARAFADMPRRAALFVLASVDQLGQMSQWLSDERKREIGRSLKIALENLQPVIEEVRPTLLNAQPRPETDRSGQ